MKKSTILICALCVAFSASASSFSDNGMTMFVSLLMLAISIIFLIRWWKMTSDVRYIREYIEKIEASNPLFLLSVGKKEEAQAAALNKLADSLFPIYFEHLGRETKGEAMTKIIEELVPTYQRFGLIIPDHFTSAEKFIEYMNQMTGNNIGTYDY